MQDILDHLTELTAAEREGSTVPASEPAAVAAEKPRKVEHNHLAAAIEAELPVARPGEALKVGKANLLEVAQTSKKPVQDDEPDTFEGA